jgi:hypothetical protein
MEACTEQWSVRFEQRAVTAGGAHQLKLTAEYGFSL